MLILLAVLACSGAMAQAPHIDPSEDHKHLGHADDVLEWTPHQQVAGYRNIEKVAPARLIPASTNPLLLPRQERDLGDVEISGVFEEQPFQMSLETFLEHNSVAGLLVIKDGHIVYEKYRLGNSETSRWNTWSVAKSVVSMLIGAAILDGYIPGVGVPVTDHLSPLKGSAYERSTVRDLLQMTSGVEWDEDYDNPESDISQASWETLALFDYLARKPRAAEPGEVFNYNTAETNLAGTLLRTAIGNNLSTYLHHKIWQPFGMEHDAYWALTEDGGGEFGGCCLAATLRDYGRLGLFAMNGGRLADGTQVLPEGWMEESTKPSPRADFYGYLWWVRSDGAYQAAGIFGQGLFIHPAEKVVIALNSAWPVASDQREWAMQRAMFEAITAALN